MLRKIINRYKSMNIIAKASLWFIFVTIVDKSISLLTQPIVNRIFSVEEVGTYGVFQSWYSIISIFASFYLYFGILEVYLTKEKDNQDNIVASLMSLSLLITVVVFGVLLVFSEPVSFFLGLKKEYIFLMALMVSSETIIQFWVVPKRFSYSYRIYSVVTIALFAVKAFLSLFLVYTFESDRVLGRLLGLVIPAVLLSIVFLVLILRKADFKKITYCWKKAFLFNLPLIPHYLSTVLLASSDKIMIEKLASITDAGIYAVSYSFAGLALIVFSAINNAYNPFSMKAIQNEKYDDLKSTTIAVLIFSVAFSLILIYLAPEGLFILGGEAYLQGVNIIPVLVVGIFFSSFYFIFSNVEFVREKNKMVFHITLFGATLNILLNLFLIPVFGYKVAAYTTLAGYLVIAVAHYFYSLFLLKKDVFNIRAILIIITIFAVLAALAIPLYDMPNYIRYIFVGCMFSAATFYLVKNRNKLFKPRNEVLK